MLRPLLKIDAPAGLNLPGRGFYQLEEDVLQVQAGCFPDSRRFFSFLESDSVRFDIDRSGRLIMIEVTVPRRNWTTVEDLKPPTIAERADVRWLDFRTSVQEPTLLTNRSRDRLLIRFTDATSWRWYTVADSLFLQVDNNCRLAAVMVTGIVDDFAGRHLARFRRQVSATPEEPILERQPAAISG